MDSLSFGGGHYQRTTPTSTRESILKSKECDSTKYSTVRASLFTTCPYKNRGAPGTRCALEGALKGAHDERACLAGVGRWRVRLVPRRSTEKTVPALAGFFAYRTKPVHPIAAT